VGSVELTWNVCQMLLVVTDLYRSDMCNDNIEVSTSRQCVVYSITVCTCAVRNCLECRHRQQMTRTSGSDTPAPAPHSSSDCDRPDPIQALIAGAQSTTVKGITGGSNGAHLTAGEETAAV